MAVAPACAQRLEHRLLRGEPRGEVLRAPPAAGLAVRDLVRGEHPVAETLRMLGEHARDALDLD